MFWNYFNHFSIKLTKKEIKNVTHIISQFHYNFFYLEEKTYYNCYYEKVGQIIKTIDNKKMPISHNIKNRSFQKLSFLSTSSMGQTILSSDLDIEGIPVYSATMDDSPFGYIKETKNKMYLTKGDIVIPARGNSIGYVTYINDSLATCTQTTIALYPITKVISKFVYYYFKAYKDYLFEYVGGAIPQITLKMINEIIVPLPPLQEQERIVNKIDKLFELVDKIEKDQQELEELKKQAKDKVLELAVTGKLVKQDPNDEPASVLLERIKAEKEKLIKEEKIKREKADLEPISDDDKNYYENIPSNWSIAKIQSISDSYIGLTYSPNNICDNGIIVLRSSNIKNGKLDFNDIIRVNSRIPSKLVVNNNDIIICARNGSKHLVGKSAFVSNINEPMTFGAFMAICKSEYSKWIYLFLQTKYYYNQLEKTSGTTTINQLTQKAFNNFALPIAPENEQKRIINKVNSLIQLL